jgi:hypothetical protein
MPRASHPDYVVDPDRGSDTAAAKQAQLVDTDQHQDRADARAGLRDLDAMTEGMTGLSRMRRDRERIFPRDTTADLGHPRMRRTLPDAGDVRAPLSARQKRERSKDRLATQASMPLTQLRAQRDLVTHPDQWHALNDQLSDATGDIQALSDADQTRVRRIDRAIQAYERANDRGHVLYSNVQMPNYINQSNQAGFLQANFAPGDRLAFDRYTAASHQLHESSGWVADPYKTTVFEIETRRGAYLGQSDKRDNTQHLLPRGMEVEVVNVHQASWRAPDGTTGSRWIIQVRDVSPSS